MRSDKRRSIEEAISGIKDGSTIAIGGVHFHNSSMIAIRELIRQNIGNLTLIGGFSLGIQIDLLVGAGLVKKVICPYVGLEHFGLAPNFKRAAEKNDIEVVECDEGLAIYGLRAGAEGLPFHPYPENVIERTDHINVLSEYYKQVENPYTGRFNYVVPAIKPDIALLHCQLCDQSGNAIYLGAMSVDQLMAESAKRVILTTDEIVPLEWIKQEHMKTRIISHFVDDIIDEWLPSHPCSSHKHYKFDSKHFQLYSKQAKEKSTFKEYLDEFVYKPKNHWGYLRAIGGKKELDKLRVSGGL